MGNHLLEIPKQAKEAIWTKALELDPTLEAYTVYDYRVGDNTLVGSVMANRGGAVSFSLFEDGEIEYLYGQTGYYPDHIVSANFLLAIKILTQTTQKDTYSSIEEAAEARIQDNIDTLAQVVNDLVGQRILDVPEDGGSPDWSVELSIGSISWGNVAEGDEEAANAQWRLGQIILNGSLEVL